MSKRPPADPVARALARNRLGVFAVTFTVLAAAAPLTVVVGIPVAYVAVAVAMATFSVGYTGMSRRIVNTGAFYSYISHGLGRTTGVAAALVALAGYNAMQIGLYGGLGVVAAGQMQTW